MENEEIEITDEMTAAGAEVIFQYARQFEAGWVVLATDAAERAYIAMISISNRRKSREDHCIPVGHDPL